MLDSGTGFSRLPCLMVLPVYTRSSCRGVLHVREAFSDGLCCAALGPSVVSNSVTPRTAAHQAPLSMGFSRREHWSGCHFLLQGIFLTQGWNSCLLHLLHWQAVLYHQRHLGSPVCAYMYTYACTCIIIG